MNNLNDNRNDDLFDDTTELRARGNWSELKGKARQQYGDLTDDDFEYAEGTQEEWYGKIASKIGRTADDVKSWFRSL
ncbi:MAG: hypothetical protein AVDCRST_MAG95-2197 [uncultured Adhaeribacter sp.]|uniref:CsbD-like domain-containing protein n=1 Tax=uncultured Adhaeribacter sp. TaxID=448109 RepID=A0A6J4IRZ3_9BACT|nr:MAG: hypothetical protein AVDCRST_MAG95-2197 [uncultured Adhaeribacter sp.]